MRVRLAFLVSLAGSWALVQGCGGVDTGIPDASDDATVDSSGTDSGGGPDGTVGDTGTNDTGTNDGGTNDASDGGAQDAGNVAFRCGDASVNDCAQCTANTQPCVYCNNNDASTLSGVCTPLHQNCFNFIPNGFADCPCPLDAAACPESYQVCSTGGGGRCHTCSDGQGNNGMKCENGGTCNSVDGGCL